jgi:stage III sporulation protein AA
VPNSGSVLILGPPGSGKTTLLRDLIRIVSDRGTGSVSVVDERGELFPREADFDRGKQTDVLTGCDKASGIDMVLRTMGPRYVAVDEITNQNDCQALIRAGWCGVKLMATAHATDLADLRQRPVYRPLIQTGIFDTVVVLKPDKSWRVERVKL